MANDKSTRKQQEEIARKTLINTNVPNPAPTRAKQKELAEQLTSVKDSELQNHPTTVNISRVYSLVGAFVIGAVLLTIVFGVISLFAGFLQTHDVFTDAMVQIAVALIGGFTSVLVELIRTRKH